MAGYRPWEIDRLTDEEVFKIYRAIKASRFEDKMDAMEAARYGAIISMMVWDSKKKIPVSILELPHEAPTEEEKARLAAKKKERRAKHDAWVKKFLQSDKYKEGVQSGVYKGGLVKEY